MSDKKRDGEVITLGSGDVMIKEFTGAMPAYTDFTEKDLIGRISGGAELEYKGTFHEAKDDTGRVRKTIITDEEVTFKSGVMTWNGKTLQKLVSTARAEDKNGIRTVKIGGLSNYNGKSYAICFHHTDHIDVDVWIVIRGTAKGGFKMAFAKDKETVVDAEFSALPSDDEGTLITFVEEIGLSA